MKTSDQESSQRFTEGQKLVGLDSNPTGIKGTDEYVYDVKLKFAEIADMLLRKYTEAGNSSSKSFLISTALQAVISTCSAVVKVITFPH